MADVNGYPDYPFATVPHPVTSLDPDGVVALADRATDAVEALLLGHPLTALSSTETLDEIVEELATGLRSDGADLHAEPTGPTSVMLRLHIPTQACAECVMPADWLLPLFQSRIHRALGAHWTVTLDDPRQHAPG